MLRTAEALNTGIGLPMSLKMAKLNNIKAGDFGEFEIIEKIKSKVRLYSKNIKAGIGDDCAAINFSKDKYMLITTDMLAENEHFSLDYFTPRQIGMKAIEANVSDIAAKGGNPEYCAISFGLPSGISIDVVGGIYDGINSSASEYRLNVVGGNITRSSQIIINVCMIGFAKKKNLVLRNGAKAGDLLFCTGDLGGAGIGLELLRNKIKGNSIKRHLEPKAKLKLGQELAVIGVNSMIDASDGLADIRHICHASNAGALIHADKIPISPKTREDARKLGKNPIDFALYGGEDFELIFTAPKNKLERLKKLDVTAIGEIVGQNSGIKLIGENFAKDLGRGFEHFKKK